MIFKVGDVCLILPTHRESIGVYYHEPELDRYDWQECTVMEGPYSEADMEDPDNIYWVRCLDGNEFGISGCDLRRKPPPELRKLLDTLESTPVRCSQTVCE